MIKPGARLTVQRLPLSSLHVTEYQRRYPERVMHYVGLLENNTTDDPGVIHVQKFGCGYEILDGHHRFCALVLSGRVDALCLVIDEK